MPEDKEGGKLGEEDEITAAATSLSAPDNSKKLDGHDRLDLEKVECRGYDGQELDTQHGDDTSNGNGESRSLEKLGGSDDSNVKGSSLELEKQDGQPDPQQQNGKANSNDNSNDADEAQHEHTSATAYSIFTPFEKKILVLTASIGAIFSPMATTIYLPSLPVLAADLHVSLADINLTVTTFLIMQGLAPALIAGYSDAAGRRPAYIICFVVFMAANVGLAVQRNFAALLVLRCVQSAGSSGTVALAQGVVADVVTSAERGTYVALASVTSIVGPLIGPILGGALGQAAGWPWVFWFQLILAGAFFLPFLLFFPETCRAVVGDGSAMPPRKLHQSLTMRHRYHASSSSPPSPSKSHKPSLSPLSTLSIIHDRESAIILFSSGLIVACLYAVNTGIPALFGPGSQYNLNTLKTGLVFIPFGSGSILSAFTTGKLVDLSWRHYARKAGYPLTRNRAQDLTAFPLERARLILALPLLLLTCAGLVAFGWVLEGHAPLAAPLVVLFFIGYGTIAGFSITQILMVDLNPGRAAAATAANNLFRCLLGAGSTAAVVPLVDRVGAGWTYTVAAGVWLVTVPVVGGLVVWGPRWRKAKAEKEKEKEAASSASASG